MSSKKKRRNKYSESPLQTPCSESPEFEKVSIQPSGISSAASSAENQSKVVTTPGKTPSPSQRTVIEGERTSDKLTIDGSSPVKSAFAESTRTEEVRTGAVVGNVIGSNRYAVSVSDSPSSSATHTYSSDRASTGASGQISAKAAVYTSDSLSTSTKISQSDSTSYSEKVHTGDNRTSDKVSAYETAGHLGEKTSVYTENTLRDTERVNTGAVVGNVVGNTPSSGQHTTAPMPEPTALAVKAAIEGRHDRTIADIYASSQAAQNAPQGSASATSSRTETPPGIAAERGKTHVTDSVQPIATDKFGRLNEADTVRIYNNFFDTSRAAVKSDSNALAESGLSGSISDSRARIVDQYTGMGHSTVIDAQYRRIDVSDYLKTKGFSTPKKAALHDRVPMTVKPRNETSKVRMAGYDGKKAYTLSKLSSEMLPGGKKNISRAAISLHSNTDSIKAGTADLKNLKTLKKGKGGASKAIEKATTALAFIPKGDSAPGSNTEAVDAIVSIYDKVKCGKAIVTTIGRHTLNNIRTTGRISATHAEQAGILTEDTWNTTGKKKWATEDAAIKRSSSKVHVDENTVTYDRKPSVSAEAHGEKKQRKASTASDKSNTARRNSEKAKVSDTGTKKSAKIKVTDESAKGKEKEKLLKSSSHKRAGTGNTKTGKLKDTVKRADAAKKKAVEKAAEKRAAKKAAKKAAKETGAAVAAGGAPFIALVLGILLAVIIIDVFMLIILFPVVSIFPSAHLEDESYAVTENVGKQAITSMLVTQQDYLREVEAYWDATCQLRDEYGNKLHPHHTAYFAGYMGATTDEFANLTTPCASSNSCRLTDGTRITYGIDVLYKTIISMATVATGNESYDAEFYTGYCENLLNKILHCSSYYYDRGGTIPVYVYDTGLTDGMVLDPLKTHCTIGTGCGETFPKVDNDWMHAHGENSDEYSTRIRLSEHYNTWYGWTYYEKGYFDWALNLWELSSKDWAEINIILPGTEEFGSNFGGQPLTIEEMAELDSLLTAQTDNPERLAVVNSALNAFQLGIIYSQDQRGNTRYAGEGLSIYQDCSSFCWNVIVDAGVMPGIDHAKTTATFAADEHNVSISGYVLKPGDILVNFTNDGIANDHALMFLGLDENGKIQTIECGASYSQYTTAINNAISIKTYNSVAQMMSIQNVRYIINYFGD